MSNNIYKLYKDLLQSYGDPEHIWPQWCAEKKDLRIREIIAIGAILTQRTSLRNTDLALRNLKRENLLSLNKLANLPDLKELTELLKPAGFIKPNRDV